jgi:hypothetical protein
MSQLKQLEAQAVSAAKNSAWDEAVAANQAILEIVPKDISALNRLGFAYLQLQKVRLASRSFQAVLKLEKSNPIALKQLANIKQKTISAPEFNSQNFVEEPSKSKIVSLHRLASKQALEKLSVGQELALKLKSRFISIETKDKTYLGSLPEDISLHLSGLVQKGNQYLVLLHSCSKKHCSVFIKETHQSPANRHHHSFASNYHPDKDEAVGEDLLLLADDVPFNITNEDGEPAVEAESAYQQKDD